MQFLNRTHAGKLLALKFSDILLDKKNTVVIALPRGGVPVAHEVAKALELPLDIILVKKIGAPNYPELAIGSVSEEDEEFYNNGLLAELGYKHSDLDSIKERALIKLQEIAMALRQGHAPLPLFNKDIIFVLKKRNDKKIIVATPVASAETLLKLEKEVDQVVVVMTPDPIYSIGEWYENFIQIETEEVIKILSEYYQAKNKKLSKFHQDHNHSDIS
jgi:putative phosphoribosyl transferase